jgi:carboxypeptidase Taq
MSDSVVVQASPYEELKKELRAAEVLGSVAAALSWDRETMMPPKGMPLRGEQSALLSQLVHERRTSARVGDLLAACEADPDLANDPDAAANLRQIRRSYDKSVRIPTSLVREFAETTTHAQHAWKEARERSDFDHFAPWLERVVRLTRSKGECLATEEMKDPYDPLIDDFEPGTSTSDIVAAFSDLRDRLAPLIRGIAESGRRPSDRVNQIAIPIERQKAFNRWAAERVGFDFGAGRLDTSTHPFCQGVGPGDTRITTRYRETGFFDALSSTLHETGHGLYEQNLPKERHLGEPLSDAVSLGIHESQSRLWENLVGRSRAFWGWALPEAKQAFAPALDEVDLDEVYGAMNIIEPSLIRVEADEATYNLHIMLRFDLERALISGDLAIADVPGAWNERIRSDLGLEVPDDRNGCLQDVHWSVGLIGYFPTYTLGNLYAAQFWATIRERIPTLEEQIGRGEFGELLGWLSREIHQHGQRYTAPELCQRITGSGLGADPFMHYLEGKLRPLYGL